jgi:hypothetical protein
MEAAPRRPSGCAVSNPLSTCSRRTKLTRSSPVVTRSVAPMAAWSRRRASARRPRAVGRRVAAGLNVSPGSTCAFRSAGRMPTSSPVPSVLATANSRTRASTVSAFSVGSPGGAALTMTRVSAHATPPPIAPPSIASRKLSASESRTSVRRPAPSAVRIAESRRRPACLASNRLARLTQTISSTAIVAASRTTSGARA